MLKILLKDNVMKKMILAMVLLSIGFAGCATFQPWSKLEKSEYVDHARGFKATVPVGWMRLTQSKFFFITYDGELLNSIVVDRVKFDAPLQNTKRKFSAEMSPQELSEVEIDALKSNPEITNVVISSNKPMTVSGKQAFSLEYTFSNKDGLKYEGRNVGFSVDDKVYLITYEAPAQNYFAKSLQAFTDFIQSFELIK